MATSFSKIGTYALGVASVIIAAVVGLVILATLFPTYGDSVNNLTENVTNQDWGNPTANALGPVLGMVVALGGLFAIIGLVFAAYKLSK